MPFRLYNHNNVPPGEYVISIAYGDGKYSVTSSRCPGMTTPGCATFSGVVVHQVALEMWNFCKANKISSDFATIVEQIDLETCRRLGNDPKHCYDTEHKVSETSPTVLAAKGRCAGCGAKL